MKHATRILVTTPCSRHVHVTLQVPSVQMSCIHVHDSGWTNLVGCRVVNPWSVTAICMHACICQSCLYMCIADYTFA